MSAALKLTPAFWETAPLSQKPHRGANRPAPRLVWANPEPSPRTHRENPPADLTFAAGGRFLSADPVEADWETGANFNRYWYANNNPYTFVDPDGRLCEAPTGTRICQGSGGNTMGTYDEEPGQRAREEFAQQAARQSARESAPSLATVAGAGTIILPLADCIGGTCSGGELVLAGMASWPAFRWARGARSLDDLSRAAGALDRGGLSAAGRALQKHGSRSGSAFPTARGNPAAINRQGQNIVDDILTTPGNTTVTRHHARFGNVTEIRAPDGRGVRYSNTGEFLGFLEPRP